MYRIHSLLSLRFAIKPNFLNTVIKGIVNRVEVMLSAFPQY